MRQTEPPKRWAWRNCRSVTLGVDLHVMPWQWRLSAWSDPSSYDLLVGIQIGPVALFATFDSDEIIKVNNPQFYDCHALSAEDRRRLHDG